MDPNCPTGCADVVDALPEVKFDDCNPEINAGEISYIYLGIRGNAFTDWKLAPEWAARLAATDATALVRLTVIGDKPLPTSNTKDISGGRKISLPKDHSINWAIDETNEVNHEMIRKIECGGNFLGWYETSGGLVFGGNAGIPWFIDGGMVIPGTSADHILLQGTASWKAKFTEERIVSPIA